MKKELLQWLRCPDCLSGWTQVEGAQGSDKDIEHGFLLCRCGNIYPIIEGTPRLLPDALQEHAEAIRTKGQLPSMVAKHLSLLDAHRHAQPYDRKTQEAFHMQWTQWSSEERIFGRTLDDMDQEIRGILAGAGLKPDDLRGRLVMEGGFGHGRYLEVFARYGATVFGIDLTRAGVQAAQRRLNEYPNVHLVQGDVLHPPFERDVFDLVHSCGVIHHTPNTRMAFHTLAERVRPGGHYSIWVYPFFKPKVFEAMMRLLRGITLHLPLPLVVACSYLPVPFVRLFRRSPKTWSQSAQVWFDFFSPPYRTHHTPEEVQRWFKEEGFEHMAFVSTPVGAIGRKFNR